MQLRKCLALLAVLLVGFGVVAVDDANAATVASVTITAPSDSGALRGIDSTFTVEVKVRDFTPIDSLECIIYLTTSTDCTVVVDADAGGDYGALNDISVIVIARGGITHSSATVGGDIIETLTSAAGNVQVGGTNTGLIAAHAYKALSLASPTNFDGDGDSIRAATSGDTTTFTWYGKIHHSSGTVPGVRAAAFAVDDASSNPPAAGTADTSAVLVSASSLKINIDADRPADPATMVWSTAASTIGNKTGSVHHTITGLTATDDKVLGVGDTIKLDVTLGGQTDPVLGADSLSVTASVFNSFFTVSKTARSGGTLNYRQVLAAGQYSGNRLGADDINATDTLAVYIVDLAGNLSSDADAAAKGVTIGVGYFVDVLAPVLDGEVVGGDTILPVSNDTITDGGMRTGYQDDINQLTFQLAEALDTLIVTFDGDKTRTIKLTNESSPKSISDVVLGKLAASRIIDYTSLGDNSAGSSTDSFLVATTAGVSQRQYDGNGAAANSPILDDTAADSVLTTGIYTITFQGKDLAGNTGAVLTRTNVLVDVDDIELKRLFPTASSALDTIEVETAKVIFQLSEVADSVMITYVGIAGTDNGVTHNRPLVGSELTNVDAEQTFAVDSLEHGTQYTLQVLAADLAGNYTQTAIDTFVYDTTFVVPVIAKFAITASVPGPGTPVDAGADVTLTLSAKTVDDAAAVTYKEAAELKITAGSGVALTGTGVTDLGNGRATLSADDWVVGERTVTMTDTTSPDTLSITVQDCTDTTNLYIGTFDSTIVIQAAARTQIAVDAAASVGQGDMFLVELSYADVYGNARVTDNGFVNVSANKLGVEVPVGDVPITKGVGSFYAKSATWAGEGLVLTVRDVIYNGSHQASSVISGTDTITVSGEGATVLDAPATIIAQDYMGAKGTGDQGGFITLSFTPSADHATLTGYRIYREVAVFSDYNTATPPALVELSEPVTAMIPWGIVDAVPGADPVYVVVATVDGDSTIYGVAAERGTLTTAKSAFDGAESIATPYEMLAETMQQSRAAVTDGPVFASLTPEALAFSANGIVPRLKLVDGVEQSSITQTASAVRSVDNIAPEAVGFMQTMDTPADAGSSITVTWAKSASDQLVTQVAPQAIGGSNVYTVPGVKGYSIYRKVGDAAYTWVGGANAGETSFVDETAFNGVRYTYQVRPFDADNITASEIEKSAMAIRNNVVDANGVPVYGLFGVDNKVDYDDFFIFADNFGLSAGQDTFDKAFDLVPNNTVDFDDFFRFADNFGREIVATGKVVPMMAGLNSDARFYLDAGSDLPRVGEELVIDVNLENFVELQAYGFGMNYDASVLEFVGARVENSILGEGQLAQPQVVAQSEGTVSLGAYGDVATKGELGLSLVFRTLEEIESSYIEITEGALQDGSYGLNSITGPVSVRIETRPEIYALSDNYPNPFNPETTIKYQLPEAGDVTLEVYNMLGQVVRSLVSEQQNAGRYVLQWDANNDAGQALSSGIYFYRIVAGGEFQSVKKMLLLK